MKKLAFALLFSIVAAFGITSCGSGSKVATAATIFADCAKADVSTAISKDGPSIFQAVLGIILSGGAGWQAELESLGVTAGKDVLACAVKAVESWTTQSASGSASTADLSPAAARAHAFIASHPEWVFVGAAQ